MAFTVDDIAKALGNEAAEFNTFNLATAGVQTLFTFGSINLGSNKNFIVLMTIDNFSVGATTATINFGQSTTATQNDYSSALSVNPALLQIFVWPPSTNISFTPRTIIQSNTTGDGSGTCDIAFWTVSM